MGIDVGTVTNTPKLSGHFGGCLFWFVRTGEVAILFLRKVKYCQINGWKSTWNLPVILQEFIWFPNCTCKYAIHSLHLDRIYQQPSEISSHLHEELQNLPRPREVQNKRYQYKLCPPQNVQRKNFQKPLLSAYDFRLASINLRNVTLVLNFHSALQPRNHQSEIPLGVKMNPTCIVNIIFQVHTVPNLQTNMEKTPHSLKRT